MAKVNMTTYMTNVGTLTELANSGKKWSEEELSGLLNYYHKGLSLRQLCLKHGRPKTGVLNKLCELRLLRFCKLTYKYIILVQPNNMTSIQKEEIAMSNANIETKVFIQGKDASEMSDSQIFSLIAKLEAEQDKLSLIKNKPKKLVALIEGLTTDIQKLVEYVDAR